METDPEAVAAIGKRIRAVREHRGITQRWLADQVGVSKQAMNAIEAGRSEAKATRIATIARVLRVTADHLLGLKEDEISEHSFTALAVA